MFGETLPFSRRDQVVAGEGFGFGLAIFIHAVCAAQPGFGKARHKDDDAGAGASVLEIRDESSRFRYSLVFLPGQPGAGLLVIRFHVQPIIDRHPQRASQLDRGFRVNDRSALALEH